MLSDASGHTESWPPSLLTRPFAGAALSLSLQRALKGQVVMSGELDALGDALSKQRIPKMWEVRHRHMLLASRSLPAL